MSASFLHHKVTIFLFVNKKNIVGTICLNYQALASHLLGAEKKRGAKGQVTLAAARAFACPAPAFARVLSLAPPSPPASASESGSPPFSAPPALLGSRLGFFLSCVVICPIANGYLMISKPHTLWGRIGFYLFVCLAKCYIVAFFNERVSR